MKRVYISGPCTGIAQLNRPAFELAATTLKSMGYWPVNPLDLNTDDTPYADAMRTDIRVLLDCDAIHLLSGWTNSRGATLEKDVANIIGLETV